MFGKCNVLHIGVCPGSTLLINLHNRNASINSNMTGAFTYPPEDSRAGAPQSDLDADPNQLLRFER